MAQLDSTLHVAEIVLRHPQTARVFQQHRIDFCCGGDVPVDQACAGAGVSADLVRSQLEEALAAPGADAQRDMTKMSTAGLIAYIIDRHHAYLREALPPLGEMMAKVARVHGERNPKLPRLHELLRLLSTALLAHLDQEEQVLFPLLMQGRPEAADLVRRELDGMYAEHLEVGDLLRRMREEADGYRVPEWGCTTYRALFAELEALEGDIHRHVHLENHVLMPRFR